MNNLKVGDTFPFVNRRRGEHIHSPSMQCIVLKTNIDVYSPYYNLAVMKCHTCKTMVGFEGYTSSSSTAEHHQILVGNKKVIITKCNFVILPNWIICPEDQTK